MCLSLAAILDLNPTRFDIWCITKLAKGLGRFPLFDISVESAIRHNVLGGIWFAASMFVIWIEGARPDGQRVRQRVWTILFGSSAAIALTLLVARLVSWLPPSRDPVLAELYPSYLSPNVNVNSFPSQSTALYSAVAAGVFSLHRVLGSVLWIAVVILVSLPRLYVGGHYPDDILAGVIVGLLGYWFARMLEPWFGPHLERFFEHGTGTRIVGELVVFLWILETAVEFREAVWIKNCLDRVWR